MNPLMSEFRWFLFPKKCSLALILLIFIPIVSSSAIAEFYTPTFTLRSPLPNDEASFGTRPYIFGDDAAVGSLSTSQGGVVRLFDALSGEYKRSFENPSPN